MVNGKLTLINLHIQEVDGRAMVGAMGEWGVWGSCLRGTRFSNSANGHDPKNKPSVVRTSDFSSEARGPACYVKSPNM